VATSVFNQKSLYKAYEKRADNISVDMEEYQKQKESDPDFYRDGSCLEYGKVSTRLLPWRTTAVWGFPRHSGLEPETAFFQDCKAYVCSCRRFPAC